MPNKIKTIRTVNDFIVKLVSSYPLHTIPENSCAEYAESLDEAGLTSDEWAQVLKSLRTTCEKYPSLPVIWDTVKQVKLLRAGIVRNQSVILFDLDGYQTCKYFIFPDIPKIPDRATNVRIRILDAVEMPIEDIASKPEAREAFRREFIKTGANPALVDKWFAEIDRAAKKQIADYDDSNLPDPYEEL